MESKVVVIFSIWAVLFGQLATIVRGANILYISSVASPSHFLWSQRLFERLAEVGHNVTVVNLYKEGVVRGVHLLKLDDVIADLDSKEDDEEDYVEFGQLNPFEMHVSFAELELQVCELAIRSTTFRRLFDNSRNSQIDLVIHDHLAGPCLLALMPVFNYPPLILASAYNRISTTSLPMGTLIFPGFIPNQVYDIDEPMSFFNRCFNVVLSCWEILFKEFVYYPKLDKLVKTAFNQSDRVSDLEKRALLAILNSGTLLEHPEPTTKNVIQVGGLHIKPTKPLPTDLIKIIDSASEGFVLLSLGTNARSDSLDSTILIEIISAMNALSNITFLWKLDSENCLPVKLPHNVFTSAWFPQNDLLAHPKIRLFIIHGGLLSTQEAVWHGVPIVGLPIYADQFGNVNQLIRKGVGRRLSIVNLKSHQFIEVLDDVIHSESYKENAMQLSRLLRDRKVTSLDDAVWSIEWVLRNANTSHVWNQSLVNLGFLQKHSYDVVAAFVCILMLIASILLLVILRGVHMLIKDKNKSKIE
ncbi:UDP-glucuronosyltransferase 2B15 [Aedes aegypti]|uniref:UDP-glucuronosyltransferase n=2 Tax=Aedes aegypti TaxID=7159 RepID=A0A903U295_AEDAE|nr:UDP-glucuronosyltransferase 2B15 [Aedes aegypti]